MAMESTIVTLPAHWASALVNGDYSGLDESESFRCREARTRLECEGWDIVSCNDETRFTWHYRLYDPDCDAIGGNVLDYTAIRPLRA